jgi:hypothetical protein
MSFATLESARTAGVGQGQVMLAPSAYIGNENPRPFNLDLVYRRGVSPRIDLGFRANFAGVLGEVKLQLRRAPDPTSGVDLALAPGLGAVFDSTWTQEGGPEGSLQAALPLLVGINFGGAQLLFAPQLRWQTASAFKAGILNVGGTVAFGRMEGPGFRVYPVLALWKSLDPTDLRVSWQGTTNLVFQPALVFRW